MVSLVRSIISLASDFGLPANFEDWNPIVEIRWSYDRLISTMGFPILVRHLYIESGPSLTSVYPTVYSGADQRKYLSSASLAYERGIHWWPANSPHKGPVTRKTFPFDDVIMGSDDQMRGGVQSTNRTGPGRSSSACQFRGTALFVGKWMQYLKRTHCSQTWIGITNTFLYICDGLQWMNTPILTRIKKILVLVCPVAGTRPSYFFLLQMIPSVLWVALVQVQYQTLYSLCTGQRVGQIVHWGLCNKVLTHIQKMTW